MYTLDKKVSAVCKIASKDTMRPILNGVLLKEGKAIATDGYRLMQVKLSNGINSDDLPNTGHEPYTPDAVVIPAKELERAVKLAPKKASLPVLTNAWTAKSKEGYIRIVSTNLETTNAPEIKLVEGDFPDVSKVQPKTPVKALVRVNPLLLAELLEAMQQATEGGYGSYIEVELRTENEPIVLRTSDGNAEGLLMPIRK